MTSLESMAKVKRVDKSKSLGSPEAIAAYLNSALASGDIIRFTEAIVTAARTEGIANVATKAGIWRESLHRLAGRSNADFATIIKVLARASSPTCSQS